MKKILLCICICGIFASLKAEIFLPKIFSDNMVLQRQIPVRVWGKAEANATVGIAFADQKIETRAKENGSWAMNLKPLKALDVPHVMTFYENGEISKEIRNILVGEVWVAGGQSNMEYSLAKLKLFQDDKSIGDNSAIRMFTQQSNASAKSPQYDSPEGAKWNISTSETFTSFSAIAFFFAQDLNIKLKVPIGIVQTALGGAKMSPWLALEDLENTPAFKEELEDFNKLYNSDIDSEKAIADWNIARKAYMQKKKLAAANNEEFNEEVPLRPKDLASMPVTKTPTLLYNAKIAPIAGFTARGFIWYQGESDCIEPDTFYAKFETIINSWRKYWHRPMPFYFVQLPSYGATKGDWAEVRWQQNLVKNKMRLVEMAVSIDTGLEKNIHPSDKEPIAKRLSKIAQKRIYNNRFMTGEYGPIFKNAVYDNDKVDLNFNLFGRKLTIKGDLRGFEILVDEDWVSPENAEVDLEKASVSLFAKEGKEIKSVRYLWKAWAKPDVSLYSDIGLPAAPFINTKDEQEQLSSPEKMPVLPIKKRLANSNKKLLPVLEKASEAKIQQNNLNKNANL